MDTTPPGIGLVRPVAIVDEMQNSYLDYAMSVIVARALPDARDGLKPVQRRILLTLHDLNLTHTAQYRKSAKICGDVSGNYHPHGEAIVYPSLVRLAQEFNMRYPLVDGQGNFGSIDGDNAAAMRYTEARMTAIAEEMLADLEKNTVDWVDTYDGSRKEPMVLPAKVPNLLLNGSSGIAVGMATNIPPHNLREVCDALVYVIQRLVQCLDTGIPFSIAWPRAMGLILDHKVVEEALKSIPQALLRRILAKAGPTMAVARGKIDPAEIIFKIIDEMMDISPEELMKFVSGPDFPTAALIIGQDGIKSAYATGHGRIVLRAKAHIEEMRGARHQIIISELSYQVNKAALIEKIAELVRDKRIDGISDIRDESDRQGLRVVVELKRESRPQQILNQLYKLTPLQTAFTANMLALVDGQPRVLTLRMFLQQYVIHRKEVVTRRTQYELEKALQRSHILEGYKKALANLDEVVEIIRRSRDSEKARTNLMREFGLTEIQAQAILDLQLRRLAALEQRKISEEYAEVTKQIAHLRALLADPKKVLSLMTDEIIELKEKYGDNRRTKILRHAETEFTEEDLIPDQEVVVVISSKGYAKRLPSSAYRSQRRSSRGVAGVVSREVDAVSHLLVANSHDYLLFFTDKGRVFQRKAHEVPDSSRQTRGEPIANLISMDDKETIAAVIPIARFGGGGYFVLATRRGEAKRIKVEDFASVRPSGMIAMDLAEGDALFAARLTRGQDELIVVTSSGQALRFSEEEIRASGRASGGVKLIALQPGSEVVGIEKYLPDGYLAIATARGYCKLMKLEVQKQAKEGEEVFPIQSRGGKGVRGLTVSEKTGPVAAIRVVGEGDELMMISADGWSVRIPAADIPTMGREAQGVHLTKLVQAMKKGDEALPAPLMELGQRDRLVGVIRINGGEEADTDKPTAAKSSPEKGSQKLSTRGKKEPATAKSSPETRGAKAARGKAAKASSAAPESGKRSAMPTQSAPSVGKSTPTRAMKASKAGKNSPKAKDSVPSASKPAPTGAKKSPKPKAGGAKAPPLQQLSLPIGEPRKAEGKGRRKAET